MAYAGAATVMKQIPAPRTNRPTVNWDQTRHMRRAYLRNRAGARGDGHTGQDDQSANEHADSTSEAVRQPGSSRSTENGTAAR